MFHLFLLILPFTNSRSRRIEHSPYEQEEPRELGLFHSARLFPSLSQRFSLKRARVKTKLSWKASREGFKGSVQTSKWKNSSRHALFFPIWQKSNLILVKSE